MKKQNVAWGGVRYSIHARRLRLCPLNLRISFLTRQSTSLVLLFDIDFELRTILYRNDFHLPITYLFLSEKDLIVSNRHRLIIYNYVADFKTKDEEYYLRMRKSKEENNHLRYFQLHCTDVGPCLCGKFEASLLPFKLLFTRNLSFKSEKKRLLLVYDEKTDQEHIFQTLLYEEPFAMALAADASFLAYSESGGRDIRVFSLKENCLYCVVRLGWVSSKIISCGFLRVGGSTWFIGIRDKDNGNGTMHMCQLGKQNPTQYLESKYKRKFSLYKRTFHDYDVADELIGPDFFLKGSVLYCISLVGEIGEAIDFTRAGNREKKNIDTFYKWENNPSSS